ncbi:hypothetical protein ABZ897_00605 [Nonomuraea sp. NPDC046802]|uniref:hypothetical protein n=1 Tax=Nonomuraea sp. NPDC046802 TaxID=3154919 RepID=UPI0033C449CE
MAETSEKTVADELREAAARAREHLLPHVIAVAIPQTAIVTICVEHQEQWETVCRNCISFDVRHRELASLLAILFNAREPLASWLEKTAHDFDVEVEEHRPDCCGDAHEESGLLHLDGCGDWVTVYRDHGGAPCGCFAHALAVARVLNGGAPR